MLYITYLERTLEDYKNTLEEVKALKEIENNDSKYDNTIKVLSNIIECWKVPEKPQINLKQPNHYKKKMYYKKIKHLRNINKGCDKYKDDIYYKRKYEKYSKEMKKEINKKIRRSRFSEDFSEFSLKGLACHKVL